MRQILVLLCVYLFFLQLPLEAQEEVKKKEVDSLRNLLSSTKNDSIRIRLFLKISSLHRGEPVEALNACRNALNIARGKELGLLEGLIWENISLAYRDLGNYSEAIESSFRALRIYDELNLPEKTASLELQIGSHFTAENNYPKAITYISQALNTFQQRKDTANVVLAMINLGETYRLAGNADSAAILFQECLELNQKLDNDNIEIVKGYARGNLGMVYATQNKEEEAIELLKSAMEILGEMGDYYSTSVYQSELAQIYIRQGQKARGEGLLHDALQTAEREKLKEQIRDISKDLSLFYEQTGRYQDALELRKQYEVYHDSLVNIENVRKTEQLESQYWLDRKDADIRILEVENQSKRRTVIILSFGAAVLLILLSILYRLQILRKRAYKKVAEQKDIIEKREKEKALLLKELNHRVKNNLQMVSSMFSLQAAQFKGEPAADALVASRRRIDALMLIHQKLYREDVDTHIRLADYIKELVDNLVYGFGKEVDLHLDLSTAKLYIDLAIPLGIIINELLTNSLKYASGESKLRIDVALKEENDKLRLIIADNGPGIPEGFDFRKSRSLGMKLVHSLIRQLQGELTQTNDHGCRWELSMSSDKLQN
ncbi:two-component sensor histidine kinase [Marinilabilia salmonicolor]|jgi:two-component sensor histidine kinase|uniref:tetratricopeptide repeat-containing sensor histidine kinase n=1 Tax=Marinilabilia salmonicolor TaxID=989 RepID=UPI000D067CF8|nr:tetratricopeptide repeat protein [Marinilabilia salmonicolor]PRZ01998.1 two-component sensor histidine kinase [Marinilabilia salmonicolor]